MPRLCLGRTYVLSSPQVAVGPGWNSPDRAHPRTIAEVHSIEPSACTYRGKDQGAMEACPDYCSRQPVHMYLGTHVRETSHGLFHDPQLGARSFIFQQVN